MRSKATSPAYPAQRNVLWPLPGMRSNATPPAHTTQRQVLVHASICGRMQLLPHLPHNAIYLRASLYAVECNSSRIFHTTQHAWPRLYMRSKATPPAYTAQRYVLWPLPGMRSNATPPAHTTKRNILGHVSICGRMQLLPHIPHNTLYLATSLYAVECNSSH